MTTKAKRQETEKLALKWIGEIDRSGRSTAYLKQQMSAMSDKQFFDWMMDIKDKKDYPPVIAENMSAHGVSITNNLEVAKKMGVSLYVKVKMTDKSTGLTFWSNHEVPAFYLPIRPQIETLDNKISVAEDNNHVDELTGQVTGPSAASAKSFPEVLVMYSKGVEAGVVELMKYRGGDIKGNRIFNKIIHEQGQVSIAQMGSYATKVKSTQTLHVFLTGMHYDNNY